VCTDGDYVVPDCLYTEEARKAVKNLLTVPACRDCNEEKGRFDGPLQHYLLADVDSGMHPEAQQLFAKMEERLDLFFLPKLPGAFQHLRILHYCMPRQAPHWREFFDLF